MCDAGYPDGVLATEGAYLTEVGTGNAFGLAPAMVVYNSRVLRQHRGPDGCYLVKGFEARWVSGIVASQDPFRLCGSDVGAFQITFNRDASQPGLDKDMQFALQLQSVRAQQQQAQASADAAAGSLFDVGDIATGEMPEHSGWHSVQTTCQ